MELLEWLLLCGAGAEFGELGLERIEEERVNHAADVFLGSVVCAELAALGGRHHALEERAEDRRRNAAPVEAAAGEERGALRRGEIDDAELFGEEPSVDIRKIGELGG